MGSVDSCCTKAADMADRPKRNVSPKNYEPLSGDGRETDEGESNSSTVNTKKKITKTGINKSNKNKNNNNNISIIHESPKPINDVTSILLKLSDSFQNSNSLQRARFVYKHYK